MKITLSVIKADIGGFVGHSESHPDVLAKADEFLAKAKKQGLLIDYHITKCGDDLQLIMTHQRGEEDEKIHKLAWDTFCAGTEVAKNLKLYGAGQDLLSDAFSGNIKGMGPGVAEVDIEERVSEPVVVFMADKTSAAASSTQRLSLIAGRYVGKDDPVCIVRCQGIFPAVGEVLEPFASPILVEGWMRGSHMGPLMPVSVEDSTPSRFDGPPRVISAGFQLNEGKLVGPRDMFVDKSFNLARHQANEMADMMRRHGPFEPHRLPLDEMEYTTMPQVAEKLKGRFVDI
jgi:fructose 1,6-bisphosphatase